MVWLMYKGERSSLTGPTLVAAAETNCWRVRAEDKGAGAGKKPWTVTARSKAKRRQSVGVVEDGMLMLAGMGTGVGLARLWCVGVCVCRDDELRDENQHRKEDKEGKCVVKA